MFETCCTRSYAFAVTWQPLKISGVGLRVVSKVRKLKNKHMKNSELWYFEGVYILWREIGHAKGKTEL